MILSHSHNIINIYLMLFSNKLTPILLVLKLLLSPISYTKENVLNFFIELQTQNHDYINGSIAMFELLIWENKKINK